MVAEPRRPTFEQLARRALRHGIALEEVAPGAMLGFDLAWRTTEQGRDLDLVEGGDCLGQSIRVALITPTGSDPFNVAFGFDGLRALTQPLERPVTEALLRAAVARTLQSDPRVREVSVVSVEPTGDPVERRWRIEAEVQTVLGEVLQLTIGEVDASG